MPSDRNGPDDFLRLPAGVPAQALAWDFVRSGGPGGQNVNKVATAVQLRLDVAATQLPAAVQARVLTLAGHRATKAGEVLIRAERYRTQARNREDALARLRDLVEQARRVPKRRRATAPSKAARQRRMDAKGRRSHIKRLRDKPSGEG
jgi:ribosome-associated protein